MPTTFCTPSQNIPHFLCENLLAVTRQILADALASSKLRQCTLLDPPVLQEMDRLLWLERKREEDRACSCNTWSIVSVEKWNKIDREQSLFPLRDSRGNASEREIARRVETWPATLAARHARHVSTTRAIFATAYLFVSLSPSTIPERKERLLVA